MSFDPSHTPTPPPIGPIGDGGTNPQQGNTSQSPMGDNSGSNQSNGAADSGNQTQNSTNNNPLKGDPSVWKPGEPVFPNIDDFKEAQESFLDSQVQAPAQPPAPQAPVQQPAPQAPAQQVQNIQLPDLDIQQVNLTNSESHFDPFDPLGLNQLSSFHAQQAPTQQAPVQQPTQQTPVQQPTQQTPVQPGIPQGQYPGMPPQPAMPQGQYPGVPPMPSQPGVPQGQYPGRPPMPPQPGMPQSQYPGMPPMPPQPGMPQSQYPGMPPMPPQPGMPQSQYSGMPPQDNTPANFQIGAKVSEKTPIKLPKHNLNFDEDKFLKLLASSISLSKQEKKKIIDTVPNLRQQQVDDLIKIFEDEGSKFAELPKRHQQELEKMVEKHRREWEDLEDEYRTQGQKQNEQSQVDDIKKQLGL